MKAGSDAPPQDFERLFWRSSTTMPGQTLPLQPGSIGDDEFRLLAEHLPTLCWIANGDGYIVWYNSLWHQYCGTTPEEMEGWGWQSVHDPESLPEVMERWTASIASGEPFEMTFPLRGADGRFRPFLTRIQPVRDNSGKVVRWFGVNTEVSAQLAAEDARRAEEIRFQAVFENAAVGMLEIDSHWRILGANKAYSDITGYSLEELIGQSSLAFTHPDDVQASEGALRRAATGVRASVEKRYLRPDRSQVVVRSYVSKVSGEGDDARYLKVIENVTEMRAAQEALQAESRLLQTLNSSGASLAAELDLEKVVQMVTDAGVELTGAQFGAFFYNIIDRAGEKYLLYALSGAERSDFDGFGMPRATAIFKPTFVGEGVVRSDDITKDPRYGKNAPHKGMPEGHLPVRSYLAVPVIGREEEVIGGLFFGHPDPGVFTARHEELMTGIAAQAAIALDNARLYRTLRDLNENLEERANEEIRRRNEVEDALRQSQKMETVGQLTGGIAHDFNNLLQIVSGNLDILRSKIGADDPQLRRYVDRAMLGAERAATLTQRLLAFSRRQPLAPKPTDVNRLIAGMSDLLHRTLGETIEIETVMAPRLWPVEIDSNQLETAIVNLAVNARDAMVEGGKLTIEAQNTILDRSYASTNPEVNEGQYVVICISDTGTGMDPDVAARAIEPFYTTKEVGKGTGLGLSMVYGFVKQSGGHLKIYSEPNEGTTVKIYLPRLVGPVPSPDVKEEMVAPSGTSDETILVCEDDEDVRAYTVEVLRDLGYKVLEAADGEKALDLVKRHAGSLDLLFTDVVLPGGMTGAVLAREAQAVKPELKILFTTGYARNAIVHQGRLDAGVELLTKPFSYADLAARIRDLLDR